MKLLRIVATNYKNCEDNLTIDFVAKSKKTSEDKIYELYPIDEELYTFNTLALVGKNASGKTTVIELIFISLSILEDYKVHGVEYSYNNTQLELYFHHDHMIYHYKCTINTINGEAVFSNEVLQAKKYYKTKANELFEGKFREVVFKGKLPNTISKVFYVLEGERKVSQYLPAYSFGEYNYSVIFDVLSKDNIGVSIFSKIVQLFDKNIKSLRFENNLFKVEYRDSSYELSNKELFNFLSSGTSKGIILFLTAVNCLKKGYDLIVDEIETHFHKTIVENLIILFKDPYINKKGACLIFTTHQCELLDLFNRQDNIYITKANEHIHLENMYDTYDIRPELLKSNQYYNNAFDTAVNYEDLMSLKKELMK